MQTPLPRKRRLLVYCDESSDKGRVYSHFYGGAAVDERKRDKIEASLNAVITKAQFQGEPKWTKIGPGHEHRYLDLINCFFGHVAASEIKVRIMFMQNIYRPQDLEEYHIDNQYFLLYYQFIKHAFGFHFCNPNCDADTHIQLMLDQLPENKNCCDMMKDYLCGLSNFPHFRQNRIIIKREDISEISSHNHAISQCLDIVLGAIQFRLNHWHKEKPKGSRTRGKRTIAKDKVYKRISERIREIYPNFNIGTNTARQNPDDVWKHPYRHWNFKPAQQTCR